MQDFFFLTSRPVVRTITIRL